MANSEYKYVPSIEYCAHCDCDAVTGYSNTIRFPELLVMEIEVKDRESYEAKIMHGSEVFMNDVFVVRYTYGFRGAVIVRPDGAVELPPFAKLDVAPSDDIARIILGLPPRTS